MNNRIFLLVLLPCSKDICLSFIIFYCRVTKGIFASLSLPFSEPLLKHKFRYFRQPFGPFENGVRSTDTKLDLSVRLWTKSLPCAFYPCLKIPEIFQKEMANITCVTNQKKLLLPGKFTPSYLARENSTAFETKSHYNTMYQDGPSTQGQQV